MLPCVSGMLAGMALGPDDDDVWCPPDRFPGTVHCWPEWMLFGPTAQVGELLSALSQRLRLSLWEVRLVVSSLTVRSGGSGSGSVSGSGNGSGSGKSWGSRTAAVMREALTFTAQRLSNIFGGTTYLLKDSLVAPGQAQTGVEAVRRLSVVAAVLLPAVSKVVRGCVDLRQAAVAAQGGSSKDDAGSLARRATDAVPGPATGALQCVLVLLAAHAGAAAGGEQQQQHGAGSEGRGGGVEAAGDSGSGGGDGGAGGRVVASSPWRALLLQDMQLMELLGAGVWLHGYVAAMVAAAAAEGDRSVICENNERMRRALVWGLALAAAAFPAEFRAAWGGGGRAEVVAQGPHGGSSSYAGSGTPSSCMPQLPACLHGLMSATGSNGGLQAVVCVLGGGDPSPGEVWGLACTYWALHGYTPDQLGALVGAMLPPEEARAAVDAAAAAPGHA